MRKIIFTLLATFLLSTPAMAEVLINIDKTKQRMTVVVDGEPTYEWKVSTGKRGYDTPSGVFTAQSMNVEWYSKQWDNAPMPHSIFYMKDGHAIHGTLEEKHLGQAASHGCVRLSRKNATTLFDLVKEQGLDKTQVIVTGNTGLPKAKAPEHVVKKKTPQKKHIEKRRRWNPFNPYGGYYNG